MLSMMQPSCLRHEDNFQIKERDIFECDCSSCNSRCFGKSNFDVLADRKLQNRLIRFCETEEGKNCCNDVPENAKLKNPNGKLPSMPRKYLSIDPVLVNIDRTSLSHGRCRVCTSVVAGSISYFDPATDYALVTYLIGHRNIKSEVGRLNLNNIVSFQIIDSQKISAQFKALVHGLQLGNHVYLFDLLATKRNDMVCYSQQANSPLRVIFTRMIVPSAPLHPVCIHRTKTSGKLKWKKSACKGGSEIPEYRVEIWEEDVNTLLVRIFKEVNCGAKRSLTVTNLTPGWHYWFRVRACNKIGKGPWSEWMRLSYSRTMSRFPDTPISHKNVEQLSIQMKSKWKQPFCEVLSPMEKLISGNEDFRKRRPPSPSQSNDSHITSSSKPSQCLHSNSNPTMTMYQSCYCAHHDVNSTQCIYSCSMPSFGVAPNRPPAPCARLVHFPDIKNSSIRGFGTVERSSIYRRASGFAAFVTWKAPKKWNDDSIKQFALEVRRRSKNNETNLNEEFWVAYSGLDCQFTMVSLKPGETYIIRVIAQNNFGWSDPSPEVSLDVKVFFPLGMPNPPYVSRVNESIGTVELSWTSLAKDAMNSECVTGYVVFARQQSSIPTSFSGPKLLGSSRLPSKGERGYTELVMTSEKEWLIKMAEFGDLVMVKASCDNYNQHSSADSVISCAENYRLSKNKWTEALRSLNLGETSFTISRLKAGALYEFCVAAVNLWGTGGLGPSIPGVGITILPKFQFCRPCILNFDQNLVTISLGRPKEICSNELKNWQISLANARLETNRHADFTAVVVTSDYNIYEPSFFSSCEPATIALLLKVCAHAVRHCAITKDGLGTWSTPIGVVNDDDVPGTPQNVRVDFSSFSESSTRLTVKWDAPVDQHVLIEGYQVEVRLSNSKSSITVQSPFDSSLHSKVTMSENVSSPDINVYSLPASPLNFVVTDITPRCEAVVRIRAINSKSGGNFCQSVGLTGPTHLPKRFCSDIFQTGRGHNWIKLKWSPPSNDQGSIIGYEIETIRKPIEKVPFSVCEFLANRKVFGRQIASFEKNCNEEDKGSRSESMIKYVPAGTCRAQIKDLEDTSWYLLRMRAVVSTGKTDCSIWKLMSTEPRSRPPDELRVVSISPLRFEWDPPENHNELFIEYRLQLSVLQRSKRSKHEKRFAYVYRGKQSVFQLPRAKLDCTYRARVLAICSCCGTSPFSNILTIDIPRVNHSDDMPLNSESVDNFSCERNPEFRSNQKSLRISTVKMMKPSIAQRARKIKGKGRHSWAFGDQHVSIALLVVFMVAVIVCISEFTQQ